MKTNATGHDGWTSNFLLPTQKEHDDFMARMRDRKIVVNPEPLHKNLPCHQLPQDRLVTFQFGGRLIQVSEYQLAMKGFYQK